METQMIFTDSPLENKAMMDVAAPTKVASALDYSK